jgi:hypothetical protein
VSTESVIELGRVPVLYVAGKKGEPFSKQAPKAFDRLEAQLPSLKGRRFYGVVVDGEYRACVAQRPENEELAIARWTLSGGKYRRVGIADWEAHRDLIGPTVADLRGRPDYDIGRPVVEYYRSQRELHILGPVR